MKNATKRSLILTSTIMIILVLSSILSLNTLAKKTWQADLKKHPLNETTVQIGIIAPDAGTFEAIEPIVQFAREDINAYCEKLGYDVNFEFIMENANGNILEHQEKVAYFQGMGINLLIAGFWSAQASSSLNYVNQHGMLMFSPSSTGVSLEIPDDNLFRLCPPDDIQSEAIATMLESKGIEAVVVILRDIPWSNLLYDSLVPQYNGVTEKVPYPEDPDGTYDVSVELGQAEVSAKKYVDEGKDTGVLLISLDESYQVIQQIDPLEHPTIDSLVWFGAEATARSGDILTNVGDQAVRYRLYCTLLGLPDTELSDEFTERLTHETKFYDAAVYDICWIYAKAVLTASTSETAAVKAILIDEANLHFGVTGWCRLNENGDRVYRDFDIWKCVGSAGNYEWVRAGLYQGRLEIITWFE